MNGATGRYIADVLQAIGFFESNAAAILGGCNFVIGVAVDVFFCVAGSNNRVVNVIDENARAGYERIVVVCGKPDVMRGGKFDLRYAIFNIEAREAIFDQKVFRCAEGYANSLREIGCAARCGYFYCVAVSDHEGFQPAELYARPGYHATGQESDQICAGRVISEGLESQARGVNLIVGTRIHQTPVANCGQVVFKVRKTGQAELRGKESGERAIETALTICADGFGQ